MATAPEDTAYLQALGASQPQHVLLRPRLPYFSRVLLRFLAARPGKVFTRETLLSRVWGYEYYGGARTVDVHVRRLRAKLGEEHAHLIETVRSVGYRFGPGSWAP